MPSALSRSFSVPINASRFSLIAKCSDPLDPTPNNCQKVNGVSGFHFFHQLFSFSNIIFHFLSIFLYVSVSDAIVPNLLIPNLLQLT